MPCSARRTDLLRPRRLERCPVTRRRLGSPTKRPGYRDWQRPCSGGHPRYSPRARPRKLRRGTSRAATRHDARRHAAAEILGLLAEDLSNKEIAAQLRIAPKTADHRVCAVLAKLEVSTRKQAARHPVTRTLLANLGNPQRQTRAPLPMSAMEVPAYSPPCRHRGGTTIREL